MSREAVESLFTMAYGYRPSVVTSAPGRVNLIGEHTDYNGGEVLPIAIAQRTWVAIAPARTAMSRAVSRERGEVGTWDSAYGVATGTWWDYVAGALAESASLGSRPHGHDVAVVSDVPMGAGLSSSAALQVATVLAALALDGIRVDAEGEGGRAPSMRDVALAAHRAETGFVGGRVRDHGPVRERALSPRARAAPALRHRGVARRPLRPRGAHRRHHDAAGAARL